MSPESDSSSDAESESGRSRKRAREQDSEERTGYGRSSNSTEDGARIRSGGGAKKRARKGPEGKPHKCQHPGCDKSYTRAEHLHRHELNHAKPKEYHCPRANCDFTCVRKDLLDRHEERHLKPGSNLNRRDVQRARRDWDQSIAPAPEDSIPRPMSGVSSDSNADNNQIFFRKPPLPTFGSGGPLSPQPTDIQPPMSIPAPNHFPYQHWTRSNSSSDPYPHAITMPELEAMSLASPTAGHPGAMWIPRSIPGAPSIDPLGANTSPVYDPSLPFSNTQSVTTPGQQTYPDLSNGFNAFTPDSMPLFDDIFAFDSFLPRDHETATNDESAMRADFYSAWESVKHQNDAILDSDSDISAVQSRPPLSRTATPMQHLLNPSSIPSHRVRDLLRTIEDSFDEPPKEAKCGVRIGNHGATMADVFEMFPSDNPGAAQAEILKQLETALNSENEIPEGSKARLKDHFVRLISRSGAQDKRLTTESRNALNAFNLDQYLKSYWDYFHPQLPILHKQRILQEQRGIGRKRDAYENIHDLQLLTMIAIGAVIYDSKESKSGQTSDQAAGLAVFLIWNVRSKLQNHTDYICPTQLWVLQTLVLIEIYEKLLSNRTMHERSQIHHTSTITLLRRGTALVPPEDLTLEFSNPEAAWDDFVRIESFKRVALATFIIDRFHAAMFSHFAQMSYTEVTRLAIPCDDELWECAKAEDFRLRVESHKNRKLLLNPGNLKDHVESAIALKRPADTLRTNLFACKTVLAGLLGFRYELQRLRWFDDEEKARKGLTDWCRAILRLVNNHMDKESVQDLRALICLAQVCTRSQLVEMQRYAGAPRVLGRETTEAERKAATDHVCKWARLSNARAAALSALSFLVDLSRSDSHAVNIGSYEPREDHLMYRPWAVWMSSLCIWSYVYTIEGPVPPMQRPDLSTEAQTVVAANSFLINATKLACEDDLMVMPGRNRCIGLLRLFSSRLHNCRWELLREASERLRDCAKLLDGCDPLLGGIIRKSGLTEFSLKMETTMKFKARKSALEKERKRTSERMEDLLKSAGS